MIGFAAQDIDGAAGLIVFGLLARKQRPGNGIGDAAAGLVLVQRPLQRSHEQVAFGAVVENHPQSGVGPTLCIVNVSPAAAT